MRTKKEINNRIDEIRHNINTNSRLDHTFDYGQLRGLKFVIECDCDGIRFDNDETLKLSYYEDVQPLNIIELRKQEVRDSYNKGIEVGLKITELNKKHENTKTKGDSVHAVNIKYKLDKAAYKQYVADMNKIEAEFKEGNRTMKFIAGEELENGDMVYKKLDGKMYQLGGNDTTKRIPATLKDVCEWWIKTYSGGVSVMEPTDIIIIRNHMEHILNELGRNKT